MQDRTFEGVEAGYYRTDGRDKCGFELAGDLPRVELFARQKAPGWDVWGNEVDSDLSLTPQENVSETR